MKNIVILVADSLRYDSVPERIEKEAESDVIPTLAPSLHTPTSFASLFTGLEAQNHNVRDFFEDLDRDSQPSFDDFETTAFFDGGIKSTLNQHIFHWENRDLEGLRSPFIWIERVMETHLPYGKLRHHRDHAFEETGKEYIQRCIEEGNLLEEYERGIDAMEDHFFRHIEELKDRGILEDTLVILTSDHGELLGERFLWRKRYEHNYPPIRPLVEVPAVFYNADVDAECMRLVDVIPTALGILGNEEGFGDGKDVREKKVTTGRNIMKDIKASFDTEWRFNGEHWEPTLPSRMQIISKTFLGDVKRLGYRKGYRPLEEKLERRREDELGGVDI